MTAGRPPDGPEPGAAIRPATTSDDDLATIARLVNAATPEDPTSVDEMRWSDATYPGALRLLAEVDGRAVGTATVGRIYMYPADYHDLWGTIVVERGHRRRGLGGRLLAALVDHARAAGKTGLQVRASEAHPEGIEFLVHRGFRELERSRMVRLELDGLTPPEPRPPDGVVLTDLAARPELVPGVHAVAVETFADIPGGDDPIVAGDLAEFRARDVDRAAVPPGGFVVAVDASTDEVVGYASLIMLPGSTTVAWHDMTAVRRSWRGRGLALALKQATIAWAIANGLTALETGNDVENAPMRAVNARLGYRPLPDELTMQRTFDADPAPPPPDGA